ncbi:MAG TPA: hydroxylamine reductase [Bacillota bacterium]|nr:hydroxylamine reductase [Bacillota bacterium]
MFCYQCEQRSGQGGSGCTVMGVCGKDANVASLQDLLIHAAQGVSLYARACRELGLATPKADRLVIESLFTTVTNVNFDPERLAAVISRVSEVKAQLKRDYEDGCKKRGIKAKAPLELGAPAAWQLADDIDGLVAQGKEATKELAGRIGNMGPDIAGVLDLVLFGLKGMAAYADHALILGVEDDSVYAFFHEAMCFLSRRDVNLDDALSMAMRVGEVNIKVMSMLDKANTSAYGDPVPTKVRVTPIKGKALLVSGHDLKDLEAILRQTQGKGINVYTHGEMLPAHGYPGLKKYAHLVGNYGGAWQDQRKEFDAFPGSIVMTTNCIQKPQDGYKGRIFTSGLVAWPGVVHIADRDFTPAIEAALAASGFESDGPEEFVTVGFGHNAVMGVAGKVIEAVKNGKIRRFFLIGGCDGAKSGRNYYTEFAQSVPDDCVILTLACGKFRFNKLQFGDIGGIPRLLDVGQCNDAYSAVVIAMELAKAFNTDVNSLPLSLVLSWYEQKAVCILLSLLYLGIRNIRLGPTLPAFLTPAVVSALNQKFNIMPITTASEDLKAILG